MSPDRTALLIRCSREEAEMIRVAAKHERRTVSGYVLRAVMNRIANAQKWGTLPKSGNRPRR